MPVHLDYKDPCYPEAAAEILRRHAAGMTDEHETNITSAVRDFLLLTGLARKGEIVEEQSPAPGSRSAVDLTALDTFIEIKSRIGTTGGFNPDPRHVAQLDNYLAQSEQAGQRSRMGILTDGKYWLLRWPGAGPVRTAPPYGFTLDNEACWSLLYEWLRDRALFSRADIFLDRASIEEHFGPGSPHYQKDITRLRALYNRHAASETVQVKRRLWDNLLRAALGEVASTSRGLDDLFVRHTYLTAVIGLAVQATFGIDIARLAESDPAGLLKGRQLQNATGLHGIVESDFFAWPTEVAGGLPLIKTLARRIARFDWAKAPPDIGAILYETVIPPAERRQLGEYYTPDWLARVMVRELVTKPLDQRVLDPACGSGTFIVEAVAHFLAAAERDGLRPRAALDKLLVAVTGIDVHPVAVHLARAAWVLAARPAIQAAVRAGYDTSISVPVYLGDALQLRFPHRRLVCRALRQYRGRGRAEHDAGLSGAPGRAGQRLRCAHERHRRRYRARRRSYPGLERPRHHRPGGTPDARADHRHDAAAARRGARPYLGLLHAQPGAPGGLVSPQGGRADRQSALAELQQNRQHAADRAGAPEQEISMPSGPAGGTRRIKTWPGCSTPGVPTCICRTTV